MDACFVITRCEGQLDFTSEEIAHSPENYDEHIQQYKAHIELLAGIDSGYSSDGVAEVFSSEEEEKGDDIVKGSEECRSSSA